MNVSLKLINIKTLAIIIFIITTTISHSLEEIDQLTA